MINRFTQDERFLALLIESIHRLLEGCFQGFACRLKIQADVMHEHRRQIVRTTLNTARCLEPCLFEIVPN